MLLLINNNLTLLQQYQDNANIGGLLIPQGHVTGADCLKYRKLWAMDNGCFNGLNETLYLEMLDRNSKVPGCLFAVVPDYFSKAVGGQPSDSTRTYFLYEKWHERVKSYGYPLAYVAQVGAERMLDDMDWSNISCLFIGGSTDWKLSKAAKQCAAYAKERGVWVHVGRVNSVERLMTVSSWGCVDSVDGTGYVKHSQSELPKMLRATAYINSALTTNTNLVNPVFGLGKGFPGQKKLVPQAQAKMF